MKQLYFVLVLLIVGVATPARVTAQQPDGRPDLRLPLPAGDSYTVSCGYGCYQHQRSMTYGVDFDVPTGTPVVVAADGVVSAITWEMGLPASLHLGDALIVYVDHGSGWFTRYVHLDGITVTVGQEVQRGQIIGYAGGTGASSPHLHFELKHGESLHAPSQPIDDLFGGDAPAAGAAYESTNELVPLEDVTGAEVLPTATAVPVPTESPSSLALDVDSRHTAPLMLVDRLAVSDAEIEAGSTVTVTFMLQNTSSEPLSLGLLGVGARDTEGQLVAGSLVVQRDITIEPDEVYVFEQAQSYTHAGDLDLFIFTFSDTYELLPLGLTGEGMLPQTSLHVQGAEYATFLPLISD